MKISIGVVCVMCALWATPSLAMRGDINGDGTVNFLDFGDLASEWLDEDDGVIDITQPVLIRDPFSTGNWYSYIPADNDGIYWWRIDWYFPQKQAALSKLVAIEKMFFGPVFEGKTINCDDYVTGDWASKGDGTDWVVDGSLTWQAMATSEKGDYSDFNVPSGHNRIHLLFYNSADDGCSEALITWDDGSTTGLDTTAYDQKSSAAVVTEIVVATDAEHGGTKRLRVMHNGSEDNEFLRIVGVRCWDTDTYGAPSSTSEDRAVGHDIVTVLNNGVYEGVRPAEYDAVSPTDEIAPYNYATAYLFAFRWAPQGGTRLFTGSDSHYGTNQADFHWIAGSDWEANGPDIFVNGTDKGGFWNITDNPKRILLTGNDITLRGEGFSDYDGGGSQDGNEPDILITYSITPNGLLVKIGVFWTASCDVSVVYCPMFPAIDTSSGSKIRVLPDESAIPFSEGFNILGINSLQYSPSGTDALVEIWAIGPMLRISVESSKIYPRYQLGAFPGGANPQAGDVWILGGGYAVRRR